MFQSLCPPAATGMSTKGVGLHNCHHCAGLRPVVSAPRVKQSLPKLGGAG